MITICEAVYIVRFIFYFSYNIVNCGEIPTTFIFTLVGTLHPEYYRLCQGTVKVFLFSNFCIKATAVLFAFYHQKNNSEIFL